MLALGAVYVATLLDPRLTFQFAKDDAAIREGEVWRLVTAGLLHGGVAHLAVNLFALSAIGPTVERLYGRAWLLLAFVGGGVAGFAASTLFVTQRSLGASAGIFALLGILLGFPFRARDRLAPAARRAMVQEILMVAVLNLTLGFMVPFIDNAAHLGGFAAGLALGLILRPREVP